MYKVPHSIERDKIFLVNRSEIEGRLDPEPYHSERINALNLIKNSGHYLPLSSIASFSKELTSDIKPGDKYVGLENILSDLGVYVETTEKHSVSSAAIFKKGDILFPKLRPYLNKVFYASFDGLCSTEFHVLRTNRINAQYLSIFLRSSLVVNQTKHLMTGNTLPRLQTEDVKGLLIPIPSKDIQERIINNYSCAYLRMQKKDYDAKVLIDSIDSFLLKTLDISLPKVCNTLNERIFILRRHNLEGRFDPTIYKNGVKLISPKWDNVKLSRVAYINPSGVFTKEKNETPISFVPMEVVDEDFSIISTKEETTIEQSTGFTKFREGDLLWAKISPCMQNGKSAIAKNLTNGLGCGSTEFFVLRPKDDRLAIEYLHVILHLKCVRETAMLYFGGSAGQQRVSVSFLENFSIPLPPKEKQIEIANHVYEIRRKAKELQKEGKRILRSAKQEVERMIISGK